MVKRKLDRETIANYSKRIKYVCNSYGLKNEDIEDCIGWIFCNWIDGKSEHQTISQSVIDWLRMHRVNNRIKSADKKRQFVHAVSMDGIEEYQKPSNDPEKLKRMQSDVYRLCSFIPNERVRIIIALSTIWGITFREIAYIMGVSESRISQMNKKGIEYLAAHVDDKADTPEMHDFEYDILDF